MDDQEMASIERNYDLLLQRYGPNFTGPYGWAASQLGIQKPNFTDIERASKIDHLRPYYRMASHNVHANPKGVFFKLGLISELHVLLAGRSNAGLTEPAHSASISLCQISSALVSTHPTLDYLVHMRVMTQLEGEIGAAFLEAHTKLKRDEAALNLKQPA